LQTIISPSAWHSPWHECGLNRKKLGWLSPPTSSTSSDAKTGINVYYSHSRIGCVYFKITFDAFSFELFIFYHLLIFTFSNAQLVTQLFFDPSAIASIDASPSPQSITSSHIFLMISSSLSLATTVTLLFYVFLFQIGGFSIS
jgi:hypothetical protein